jgi:hypothetical protein
MYHLCQMCVSCELRTVIGRNSGRTSRARNYADFLLSTCQTYLPRTAPKHGQASRRLSLSVLPNLCACTQMRRAQEQQRLRPGLRSGRLRPGLRSGESCLRRHGLRPTSGSWKQNSQFAKCPRGSASEKQISHGHRVVSHWSRWSAGDALYLSHDWLSRRHFWGVGVLAPATCYRNSREPSWE